MAHDMADGNIGLDDKNSSKLI